MTPRTASALEALQTFAEAVTKKMTALAAGEPEDQLRGPVEVLFSGIGVLLGRAVVAKGESRVAGRIGRPDYAILVDGLLCGYLERKAPGTGARPNRFRGHDSKQWQRFHSLPNLIYSDGREWALFRHGEQVSVVVTLAGDVTTEGKRAVDANGARALSELLARFFAWEPIIPRTAKQLAEVLAPLCRMLRDDVIESLADPRSALVRLAKDWRELLFPEADDPQFADAYAQTVTYALLLARSEGADTLKVSEAVSALGIKHTLLARALEVLTDRAIEAEIGTSLHLLQRVIHRIDPGALASKTGDPWLYFYEDFLSAYDPELRKDAGVYYTPVAVVHAQVRLIDQLLRERLGMRLGFANDEVITLDPAVGTGTYLLGIIEHAVKWVIEQEGEGAIPGRASRLAKNLHGFEIMVGPYAVAELRLTQALEAHAASVPREGVNIFLTDTLESPSAKPTAPPLFLEPIAKQHERALEVKDAVPVLVCLGNPPYDRHPPSTATLSRKGGWVRYGAPGETAILRAFVEPVERRRRGRYLKNLYNLYVYFWRWALWKVFEAKTATGPGIVSFISASSYLQGDAFLGMREHLRRVCDAIWIIDLGGEGRGTRVEENIFSAIRTPVAIAIAARLGAPSSGEPAVVRYARLRGPAAEKLSMLEALSSFTDLEWKECPSDWHEPFYPRGEGAYFEWPALTDVFPWQHAGVEMKRLWPIAPDEETLKRRWRALLASSDRRGAFHETRDRTIHKVCSPLPGRSGAKPIADLATGASIPEVTGYAYRSFDRHRLFADSRVGDFMRPALWEAHGPRQIYLTTLLTHPLGRGPSATVCSEIPDRHHFRGSIGGRDVIPLWRDRVAEEPNIAPAVLMVLAKTFGTPVQAEDVFAYCYGILGNPGFTDMFFQELEWPGPRVPISLDPTLFAQVRDIGRKLIWLHTYGDRLMPPDRGKSTTIPTGTARCIQPVSNKPGDYPESFNYDPEGESVTVGTGRFRPVDKRVWHYEIAGYWPVQSWLGYRMKYRRGRRSSPLDDIHPKVWSDAFTTELLTLLWILERTVELQRDQQALLRQVVRGPVLRATSLPRPPSELRAPPGAREPEENEELFTDEE